MHINRRWHSEQSQRFHSPLHLRRWGMDSMASVLVAEGSSEMMDKAGDEYLHRE
jgi:hypothetical protein